MRRQHPASAVVPFALVLVLLAACAGSAAPAPTPGPAGPAPTRFQAATQPPAAAGAPPATVAAASAPATTVAKAATQPAAPAAAPAATAAGTPAPAGPGSAPPPAGSQTAPPAALRLQQVAAGLASPVALVPAPDNSGRLYVVDQAGLIRVISADGKLQDQPYLDLRDRMVRLNAGYDERGLLGLAFHPDFARNGRVFVYYTAPLRQGGTAGFDNTSRLSEFHAAGAAADRLDPATEKPVLEVDHPQANHDGGTIAFGPDGYLYLGIGDGGGANDVGNGHTPNLGNGQDTNKLLGKILRLDVNAGSPYGIPADNPFAGGGGAKEVYAYGLRNPYRFSFDRGGNHELLVADVGQNLYEEVNIIARGGNYGWNIREGLHCFNPGQPSRPPGECANKGAGGQPLLDPIIEYSHSDVGIAVIGGFIYRGQAIPGLAGHYVFGDWSTGFGQPGGTLLVATRPSGGQGAWQFQKLQVTDGPGGKLGHYLLGIGQDASGELYALTTDNPGPQGNTGKVFKLTAP
jgi:glucose/arabinose dehydrogenase